MLSTLIHTNPLQLKHFYELFSIKSIADMKLLGFRLQVMFIAFTFLGKWMNELGVWNEWYLDEISYLRCIALKSVLASSYRRRKFWLRQDPQLLSLIILDEGKHRETKLELLRKLFIHTSHNSCLSLTLQHKSREKSLLRLGEDIKYLFFMNARRLNILEWNPFTVSLVHIRRN